MVYSEIVAGYPEQTYIRLILSVGGFTRDWDIIPFLPYSKRNYDMKREVPAQDVNTGWFQIPGGYFGNSLRSTHYRNGIYMSYV